jgi:hypothetical protein
MKKITLSLILIVSIIALIVPQICYSEPEHHSIQLTFDNTYKVNATAFLFDENNQLLHKTAVDLSTNTCSFIPNKTFALSKNKATDDTEIKNYVVRVITDDGRVGTYSFGSIDMNKEDFKINITFPNKKAKILNKKHSIDALSYKPITLNTNDLVGTLVRSWHEGYTAIKFNEIHSVDGVENRLTFSKSSSVGTQMGISYDLNSWTAQGGYAYTKATNVTQTTPWISNGSTRDYYCEHKVIVEEWVAEDNNNNLIYWYEKKVGSPTNTITSKSDSMSASNNNVKIDEVHDSQHGSGILFDGSTTSGSITSSESQNIFSGLSYLGLINVEVKVCTHSSTKLEWKLDFNKHNQYALYDENGKYNDKKYRFPIFWSNTK